MKKYESIMKRVREVEEKHGIKYARPDGKLYKGLKISYTLVFIYTLFINLMFIAGMLLVHSGNDSMASVKNYVINAAVCSGVLIIAFIFMCIKKLRVVGLIASIVPLPFMAIFFGVALKDDLGFLGFKLSYYWRHLGPAVIMFIFIAVMLIIALRAAYKTNKRYKHIVNNLYATYHSDLEGEGENALTEEQWEEFLKNYDPRGYKDQFSAQLTEVKEKVDGEKE